MLAAARRVTAGWWSSRAAPGSGRRGCWPRRARLPQAAEFEVLTARGGELEGEFAFGIVRQLFEAPLAAATPELARRAAWRRGWAERVPVRLGAHERVRRGSRVLVRDAARPLLAGRELRLAQPTLLVVDDLHWADEPSLRWLALSRPPARRAAGPASRRDAPSRAGQLPRSSRNSGGLRRRGDAARRSGAGVGCRACA